MNPMDQQLNELRARAVNASAGFLDAQRVYQEAADAEHQRPEAELKQAAEAVRSSADLFEAALTKLLEHLRAAEPSEARDEEIRRAEVSLGTLGKE